MKGKRSCQALEYVLFILYGMTLLRITVFRSGCFARPLCSGRLNLVPGLAYKDLISWGSYGTAAYLFLGNIAWFVPLGWFLCWRGWDFWACLLCGLTVSLLIEGGQFILGTGLSETDDLILNTLGAAAGYLMGQLCCKRFA